MTTVDKQSAAYLAGRADMANEMLANAKVEQPLTLDDVREMTTEQVLARRDEVDALLEKEGRS